MLHKMGARTGAAQREERKRYTVLGANMETNMEEMEKYDARKT